jgi:hypothetical protein
MSATDILPAPRSCWDRFDRAARKSTRTRSFKGFWALGAGDEAAGMGDARHAAGDRGRCSPCVIRQALRLPVA